MSKQWDGCQGSGFLTSTQMLVHVLAHRGCEHCKRVCSESQLWEKSSSPHWGVEPVSVIHWTRQSTELNPSPIFHSHGGVTMELNLVFMKEMIDDQGTILISLQTYSPQSTSFLDPVRVGGISGQPVVQIPGIIAGCFLLMEYC